MPSECESSVDIKGGLAGKLVKEDGTHWSVKWCELIQIICSMMRHCIPVNGFSCKVTVTSLDRCYSKQNIIVSVLERVPHLWRLKYHLPAHLSHSRWCTRSSWRGFLNHLTYLIKTAFLGILFYLYVSSPRNPHGFCDPEPADSLGHPGTYPRWCYVCRSCLLQHLTQTFSLIAWHQSSPLSTVGLSEN